jgi:hypothetical protein
MDQHDDALAREDGRYFALDKLGSGVVTIATSERLGRDEVSFGLPSGPALFLHLAHRAFMSVSDTNPRTLFDDHTQGIWPDSQGPLFDYLEACIAHIIFSFSAIEAFANETIPDDHKHELERDGKMEILAKAEIERRVGLDEKLHTILPAALSMPSPKGTATWERYRVLKKLRDRLVHLKSEDRRKSGPEEETVWGILLRMHGRAWCDDAHTVIGYFEPAVRNRRWFGKYPFE